MTLICPRCGAYHTWIRSARPEGPGRCTCNYGFWVVLVESLPNKPEGYKTRTPPPEVYRRTYPRTPEVYRRADRSR
jgi:hypothetical protein